MKKIILILCLCICIGWEVHAQSLERSVIGSSGATLISGSASLDFTVGELAVTTFMNGATLTQGFHQGSIELSITVNPIVFLQGAAVSPNTGEETLMRDDLRVGFLIPDQTPYSDGATLNESVFAITGNNAIVDWVWVEIRDGNDNASIIDSQSALLQRDGDIVSVDGLSPISFDQVAGDYYVAINHRNHLGIISATKVSLSSATTVLDFTSGSGSAQGGANALIDLGNGIFAVYAGDYDNNTLVQNTDAASVIQLIGGGGYSDADIDANSLIQNTDLQNLIYPNLGRGEQFSTKSLKKENTKEILDAEIEFTLLNAQITNNGGDDFYEADVFVASTTNLYLGSGQLYFDYNPAAFGSNISDNGNIEYSQPAGSILGYSFGSFSPAYKSFIQNDFSTSRVSLSFQQNIGLAGLETEPDIELSSTPNLLFHIKIRCLDAGQNPNFCFYADGDFQDQFFTASRGTKSADITNSPGAQLVNDTYNCSESVLSNSTIEFEDIVIYPNPATEEFYIKGLHERSTLSIYDLHGRLVLKQEYDIGTAIDISGLEPAMYMVLFGNSSGKHVKRLVKQ